MENHPYDLKAHNLLLREYNARARLLDEVDHNHVERLAAAYKQILVEIENYFGDRPHTPYRQDLFKKQ